jgi:hypothetical protein
MLHRAYTLPLSKDSFDKEIVFIKLTADVNGYAATTIDKLLKKHSDKKIRGLTTLAPIEKEITRKRAGLTTF